MTRMSSRSMASNANAIRLYEKLGFKHEGLKRRARHLDAPGTDNRPDGAAGLSASW